MKIQKWINLSSKDYFSKGYVTSYLVSLSVCMNIFSMLKSASLTDFRTGHDHSVNSESLVFSFIGLLTNDFFFLVFGPHSWKAQQTLWDSGDRTLGSHIQGKCPPHCAIIVQAHLTNNFIQNKKNLTFDIRNPQRLEAKESN